MKSLNQPRHKIDRQFEALAHYKREGFSYPLTAEIDLTWRCALNCKGCHSKWMHSYDSPELNEEQAAAILMDLKQHGCKSVVWSGGGDPMESRYFFPIIRLANELGFDQGLYTYFPNPSQEVVTALDSVMDFVYSHNFRTKGLYRIKGSKNIWTANWLLDAENYLQMRNMVDKVDLDFFQFVDFRPLIMGTDYSWVEECLDMLSILAVSHPRMSQIKYADYKFKDLLIGGRRDYKTCYSTDFQAVIGPNGDMYECINRRKITTIGNILTEGLEAVWKRKLHERSDFDGCRILCRNHEMNKSLYQLLGPAPQHASFV